MMQKKKKTKIDWIQVLTKDFKPTITNNGEINLI